MQRGPRNHYQTRGTAGSGSESKSPAESEVLLHWGNRKRLRCVKFQRREDDNAVAAGDVTAAAANSGSRRRTATSATATVRAERRVVRAEKEAAAAASAMVAVGNPNPTVGPTSPRPRLLRNSEATAATKANGTTKALTSPERGGRAGGNGGGGGSASADDKPGGGSGSGGSSSGSEGSIWPNFVIALTNKEKEEDFLIFKGSKLPLRPKKRTKVIQKTVNLVSPGTWLSDLTLDRYEVREKKTSKKKPRGLKAMGSMESDSE